MTEKHIVLTGDTRRFGNRVTLPDGTEVDTTPGVLFVDSHDLAWEIAHQISLSNVEHGHPDDVEFDHEAGEVVQRPFAYDDSNYKAHFAGKKG